MAMDMFICGACQQVFHNVEEFIQHKNTCQVQVQGSDTERQIVMLETDQEASSTEKQISCAPILNEEACAAYTQPQIIDLPSHIVQQETVHNRAPILQGLVQVPTSATEESNSLEQQPSQMIEHHVVHLQNENGLQQLQIESAPGQNVELQDIIAALERGQAITVQDAGELPAEIQLVVGSKSNDTTQETSIITLPRGITDVLPNVVLPDGSSVPNLPVRKRGRPKKGQEKSKPAEKKQPEEEEEVQPKEPEKDAEGKLVCGRCKKKFTKERHFNTHKCLAMSDYVDIMEKELLNLDEDANDEEDHVEKDADFRAPPSGKKRKIQHEYDASVVILKSQRIKSTAVKTETVTEQAGSEQHDTVRPLMEKKNIKEDEPEPTDKTLSAGLEGSMDEVADLVKEGLADFPGAGDIKLSQVRVDDGTEDPKLHDALRAILEAGSDDKESQKSRRGRKPKGTFVDLDPARKNVKSLPIFKNEDERLEFEKCANVDLQHVDNLYRHHVIDQDINEFAPPLKNRVSDKLNVFSCNVCEKIIMSKSHARLHCITHTNLRPFKCFKCDFSTNTKGNLYSHMRKHTGQLYHCSVCPFHTINKGHLIEHEAVHSKERHECEVCCKDYSTQKSLYGHVRRKHNTTKKGKDYLARLGAGQSRGQAILHQCHICNRKFKKKIDRDRHMYMHDIKDNPYVLSCELCNRTCSRRAYLEKHLTRHRMIYFCSECDNKFPSTLHLTQHLTEIHFGTESASEQSLKERFEKCIESSIYLPEPDGSVSFEEEVEESASILSARGDAECEETQKDGDNISIASSGDQNEAGKPKEKINPPTACEESLQKDIESQPKNIENSSESLKIKVDNLTCNDNVIKVSPYSKTSKASNESDESTGNSEGDTCEKLENKQTVPVQSVSSTAADCVESTDTKVLVNGTDEQTKASDDEDTAEGSTDRVYNKAFFKTMGFKALTLDIYNRIRQVFGREECEFCGRLYFSSADFEQHLRTHTGERPFGCNQCSYKAISKENLKRHIETDHDKVKFVCNECDFMASNRSQLWSHAQGHKNPEAYECPACAKTFAIPKQLKLHINVTHPELPDDAVRTATTVQHRARTKIGRKCYKCPHCDRGIFKNAADLQKHIWIHEGVKPFKCPLCPHACRSRNNLASHMIRHSMDKPFLCTECGRAYKSKTALRWHVRSHKDGKFKCLKCPYEATQSSHLKRHMETHDIIKRYVCQQCAYSSNTLGYLKIHYTRNHKGHTFTHRNSVTNQIPMVRTGQAPDTKIYRCLSCDYLFGNLSDMKRHLKLRHHIQMEHMNQLDEINMDSTDGTPQVLAINTEDSSQTRTVAEQGLIQQDVIHDSEVQIVQLNEQLSAGTISTQDGSLEPLEYSIPAEESGDKMHSAVNILQQIIGMSQGAVDQQEIIIKSEDGQSFVVQHEGEVVVASDANGGNLNNDQYVIQYVMADDQEVTTEESVPGDVKQNTDGHEISGSNVEVQHQDMSILPVSMEAQDIANINNEQHAHVVDEQEDISQPLVLDFDESSSSRLPPHMV